MSDSINVSIRVRPLNERELSQNQYKAWHVQNDSFIYQILGGTDIKPLSSSNSFVFDHVFQNQSTSDIYQTVAKEIIQDTLDGINGTIFAYGQTSSGKTYTMQGSEEEPGIIPLAVEDVFKHIEGFEDREFLLRVSYLEIYNENIRDLLSPGNDNLKVHEDPNRNIFVGNLTEEIVMSPQDIMNLMRKGERSRHVGGTNMNERSSRSHTIFRMVIESRERGLSDDQRNSMTGAVKVSHLNLVDLAGSERVGLTGAEGIRLKEGGHINKSLLTLGSVIGKLSEGNSHIPYRDSKLTRILQPSLGGNARTAIICTVTPASSFIEDTLSTLKFANRAKTIKNKPQINETVSDEALLKKYKNEINSLKKQLVELQSNNVLQEKLENAVTEKKQAEEELQKNQSDIQAKLDKMTSLIINSQPLTKKQKAPRRKTWFPGALSLMDEDPDDEKEEVDQQATDNKESEIQALKEFSTKFEQPKVFEENLHLKEEIEVLRKKLEQEEKERTELKSEKESFLNAIDAILYAKPIDQLPQVLIPFVDSLEELKRTVDLSTKKFHRDLSNLARERNNLKEQLETTFNEKKKVEEELEKQRQEIPVKLEKMAEVIMDSKPSLRIQNVDRRKTCLPGTIFIDIEDEENEAKIQDLKDFGANFEHPKIFEEKLQLKEEVDILKKKLNNEENQLQRLETEKADFMEALDAILNSKPVDQIPLELIPLKEKYIDGLNNLKLNVEQNTKLLQNDIIFLTQEREALNSTLLEQQQNYQNLENQLNHIKVENQNLKQQIDNSSLDKKNLAILLAEKDALNEELECFKELHCQMEGESLKLLEDLTSQLDAEKEKSKLFLSEKSEYLTQIEQEKAVSSKLKSELDNLLERQQNYQDLEIQLNCFKDENQALKQQCEQFNQEKENYYISQIEQVKEVNLKLKSEIDNLLEQQRNYQNLENQLNHLKEENQALKQQCEQFNQEKENDYISQIEQEKAVILQLKSEIDNLLEQNKNALELNSKKDEEINILKQQINELQREKDQIEKENQNLLKDNSLQLESERLKIQELTDSVQALTKEKEQLINQTQLAVKEHKEKFEQLTLQLETEKQKIIQELTASVQTLTDEKERLITHSELVEKEHQEKLVQLTAQLETEKQKINELNQELEKFQDEKEQLEAERLKIKELTVTVQTLTKEKEKSVAEYQILEKEHQKILGQLNEQKETERQNVETLKQQVEQSKKEKLMLTDNVSNLEEQISKLEHQLSDYIKTVDTLKEELNQNKEMKELENNDKLIEKQKEIQTLYFELERVKEEKNNLKNELKENIQIKNEMIEKYRNLKQELLNDKMEKEKLKQSVEPVKPVNELKPLINEKSEPVKEALPEVEPKKKVLLTGPMLRASPPMKRKPPVFQSIANKENVQQKETEEEVKMKPFARRRRLGNRLQEDENQKCPTQ